MSAEQPALQRAIERIDTTFASYGRVLEQVVLQSNAAEERAQERHRQLLERSQRESGHVIAAISEVSADLHRVGQRLDDMKDEIRANTQAVLSVLDRLEPGTT